MKRILSTTVPLALGLITLAGCRANYNTDPPELADKDEEALVGVDATYDDDSESVEQSLDEQFGKLPELPEIKEPTKKCTGKGKKKECKMVDPTPEVTAAHAARKFLKGFRWEMTPQQVLGQLSQEIEEEYADKQKKAKSAIEQDQNREWKRAQIDELALSHIKFETRAKHKWGVSLIQFDYEDDSNEEMVWVRANANLKKFFFFKDQELWKVVYAYSSDSWPGENHKDVVEKHFKKWFGVSPEEKVKQHPETKAPLLRYLEWKTTDGDIVRAFDQTAVHGVHVLAFIDGDAEQRIGERLPNIREEAEFSDAVNDVMGGTDVCYDEEGNLIEDAQKCAEIMGMDEAEE